MISEKDIEIHPLTSLKVAQSDSNITCDDSCVLYFYKGRLCRSPSIKYQSIFDKVVNLPYVQKTVKTNDLFNWNGNVLPVYDHKHYTHVVRIDEVPHSRRKNIAIGVRKIG